MIISNAAECEIDANEKVAQNETGNHCDENGSSDAQDSSEADIKTIYIVSALNYFNSIFSLVNLQISLFRI